MLPGQTASETIANISGTEQNGWSVLHLKNMDPNTGAVEATLMTWSTGGTPGFGGNVIHAKLGHQQQLSKAHSGFSYVNDTYVQYDLKAF